MTDLVTDVRFLRDGPRTRTERRIEHVPGCPQTVTHGGFYDCNCPLREHEETSHVLKFTGAALGEKVACLYDWYVPWEECDDEERVFLLADARRSMEEIAAVRAESAPANPLYWPPKGTS